MESLTENKALLYSIVGSAGAILALAMGIFPDMAYQFEIVDFPPEVSCCFHTNDSYIFYPNILGFFLLIEMWNCTTRTHH
jgi:hypothetical protein